jgi:hypothetical protein
MWVICVEEMIRKEMKEILLILTFVFLVGTIQVLAQSTYGDFLVENSLRERVLGEALRKMAEKGDRAEDFVPPHWKIGHKAEGDLNADGKTDYVFEITVNQDAKDRDSLNYLESLRQMNNDAEWISGVGAIVIVDSRGDGKLHFDSYNSNLFGADSFEIKKGVIIVQYNTGGSYHIDATYRFRQQPPTLEFKLIGFDVSHYCNSCNEASARYETSDNYLTNTRIETTYKIVRGEYVPTTKQVKMPSLEINFSDARFNDNIFYGKEISPF